MMQEFSKAPDAQQYLLTLVLSMFVQGTLYVPMKKFTILLMTKVVE